MTRAAIAIVDAAILLRGRCVNVIDLWRRTKIPRGRLTKYVRRCLCRRARRRTRLQWTTAGAVWALDWTQLEMPLECLSVPGLPEGIRQVLVVRDLATSKLLAVKPAVHATAEVVDETLESLFTTHGAPLVLKSDNGSNVIGGRMPELLEEWRVIALRSPPRTPRYNGSIEASVGSIKRRLERIAADAGRPRNPTLDDLREVRLEANATARPRGPIGPTPDELWAARPTLTLEDRETLAAAVGHELSAELARLGLLQPTNQSCASPLPPEAARGILSTLGTHQRANVVRRAIRRSLEATGHLIIRRPAFSSTQQTLPVRD